MRPEEYIVGLDDREPTEDERFEERLLAYGFDHSEIERCLSEIEAYAKKGRTN